MNAIPFDTLKLARGFEAAGMSPAMANGSAEALAVAMKDTDCATKADVTLVRTELKGDIAALRIELKSDIAALRTELKGDMAAFQASVKTDFAAVVANFEILRRDMTIKLGGMIFLAAGLTIAAMRFLPPPH